MEKQNVKDLILLELEQQERPLAWLSRKSEIPYGTPDFRASQASGLSSCSRCSKIRSFTFCFFINILVEGQSKEVLFK